MSKEKNKVLEIENLTVQYPVGEGRYFNAVKDISFGIEKGEVVGLVGESGSGKSTTAKAILALSPHSAGSIKINGELVPNKPRDNKGRVNKWLASKVQMIFQDAKSSLNPREKVFDVVVEGAMNQKLYQKQKLANTIAFAEKFVEKNAGLKRKKTFELFVAEINKEKKVVTQRQLHEVKYSEAFTIYDDERVIVGGIKSKYKTERNAVVTSYKQYNDVLKAQFKAANKEEKASVGINVKAKRIAAKTRLNNMLAELKTDFTSTYEAEKQKFDEYKHTFKSEKARLSTWNKAQLKTINEKYQAEIKKIKITLRDNEESKNFTKNYYAFKKKNKKELTKRAFYRTIVKEVMDKVSISSEHINRYPGEFSGGQAQRIAIARTLAMKSDLIIADEPISALDVSIQAQVINLLKKLIKKEGLTVLFIAHDLQVVRYISDKIIVMYKGELIEKGDAQEVYNNPMHPYTQSLINAVPSIDDPSRIRNSKPYKAEHFEDFSNYGQIKKEWFKINDKHEIFGTKEQIKRWLK